MTSLTNIGAAREPAAGPSRFARRGSTAAGESASAPARAGDLRLPARAVHLRLADGADAASVRRLAALDDARVPEGRVLLALLDGEPKVALSLRDGRVVADPFARTGEAIELLLLRAEQLRSPGARHRSRRGRTGSRPAGPRGARQGVIARLRLRSANTA